MKHKHGIVCMHRCLNKFTCKRKGSKRCRVAEEAARQPAVCTRQAVLLRSLQSSEETWAQLAAATGECEETAGNDLLGQTLLLRSSKGSSCDEKSLVTGLVNIAVVHVGGGQKKRVVPLQKSATCSQQRRFGAQLSILRLDHFDLLLDDGIFALQFRLN